MSAVAPTNWLTRRARLLRFPLATRRGAVLVLVVSGIAATLVLLAHDLFTNMGSYWLVDWDESRHIANAMEMLHRGDWVVNTYRGTPDFYNLKPPASFWAIMLSVQSFGASALSVRLPSALATLASWGLCTVAAWRWKGPVAALVTAAAFSSSLYLVDLHSGRTADPDALFVLFSTSAVLSAAWSIRRPWLLTLSTTAFSLAFLTKSFHATMILPLIIAVPIVARRTTAIRPRHLVVALLGLLPLAAWAGARFAYDGTSFFAAMLQTDVLARSEAAVEGHVGGPDYYFANLQATFGLWLLVGAIGLVTLLGRASWSSIRERVTHSVEFQRAVLLGGWVVMLFLGFSVAASKLPWYTIPALPTLSVLVGVAVGSGSRQMGRPAMAGVVALCLTAVWLGQTAIMTQRRLEQPISQQVAMSLLRPGQVTSSQNIYVDSVLTGWQQNLVAVSDMFTSGMTQDGNEGGYLSDPSPRPVSLVQAGSTGFSSVMRGNPKVLSKYLDWWVVERTTGPVE